MFSGDISLKILTAAEDIAAGFSVLMKRADDAGRLIKNLLNRSVGKNMLGVNAALKQISFPNSCFSSSASMPTTFAAVPKRQFCS